MVHNFADFCKELLECGFSMGGGNSKGIYAIVSYDWKEQFWVLERDHDIDS